METGPTWADLTLYLARPGVAQLDEVLRRPDELRAFDLRADASIDGRLFFLPEGSDEPPPWVAPLDRLADNLPELRSSSPRAVLVFRAAGRVFATPFGRGHFRLRSDRLVDDFGLRTAANKLDPEALVGVDARAIEQTVFLTRRQASRGTELGVLGLESDRESVHSMTGKPRDEAFARRITGRVGFHIARQLAPSELADLAAELLDAYVARDYEQPFGFLDRRRLVDDLAKTSELDGLLVAGLATPGRGGAYLAPPEVVDWANVGGFYLSGDPRGSRRQEVTMADYADTSGNVFTMDRLQVDAITLYARDGRPAARWPVYKCLIAERREADGVYILARDRRHVICFD